MTATLLIAAALLLQVLLAIGGAIVNALEGGTFGAPVPFGRNPGLAGGFGAQADFWPVPFAVDVAITWALFWMSERVLGRGAGIAAAIGALTGFGVLAWTYIDRDEGTIGLPFVVAAARSSPADQLAAYADTLVFAAAFALAWSVVRGRSTSNTRTVR